jgi:hypothetical protein
MAEDRSYAVLGFGEKKITFDVADMEAQVANLMTYLVDNIARPYNEGASMSELAGFELLKQAYGLFEQCMHPFAQASSCEKGCSHCCHHGIEATPIEAK